MVLSTIVLFSFLCIFRHDSPKYYISIDDEEMARFAIRKFYDMERHSEDEIYEFLKASSVKDTSTTTLKQALTDPKYKMGSFVALVLIFFHEIVGINVVLAYSSTILDRIKKEGGSSLSPKVGTIIMGIV